MNIVTIGDSVCWGQGLLAQHKFDALLASKMGAEMSNFAHSGATIGMLDPVEGECLYGEVPLAEPTIYTQWTRLSALESIDKLIVNGGINDVDFRRILNPLTSEQNLTQLVRRHCEEQMFLLLKGIAESKLREDAVVIVVGYYPVLSPDSIHFVSTSQLTAFLTLFGVSVTLPSLDVVSDTKELIPTFIRNCLTFWHASDFHLNAAVQRVSAAYPNGPKFRFAKLPFTEKNAVFGSDPLLWGLNPDSSPQDEVRSDRAPQCEAVFGDLVHLPSLMQCYRASAGHPNVAGAQLIAETIEALL